MRVRRERDGYIQIYSNLVTYFRNFGETDLPNTVTNDPNPNEIIHFKKYTPTNTYYGLPDIFSAKNALAGNEFASRYNLDFFENQAIPRYAIIAKKSSLSTSSVARLIEFFESGVRGQPHRTIFIPLSDDENAEIKFEQIETGDKDGAFGSFRSDNNEDIFMAHRVPFTRAGVYAKGMTLAAARDADKVFKESVSGPEQEIFNKKFNKIVREISPWVEFKLNELALTDEDTQSKIDERDVRMGIKVPDEVRATKGDAPRPDGKGNEPWQANAQKAAELKAQAGQTRARDSARSAGATDSAGEGRKEKGAGRSTQ
jgi:capsid portal protein